MSIDLDRRSRKQRLVAEVPEWWHSIDLGDGVITAGHKTPEILDDELAAMDLPSLVGKSVLDIGAWDGFFSFAAERRGAARVVALDHFIWALKREAAQRYVHECKVSGTPVPSLQAVPNLWDYETLPGRRGFDACHSLLNSHVEPIVGDFMTMDLAALGTFDVVLFLGVLYHLEEPLQSLHRLRSVTREIAVIESEMVFLPGLESRAFTEFYPADELSSDYTNWWAPNMAGLIGLARHAGFRDVRVKKGPPAEFLDLPSGHEPVYYRGIVQVIV